MRICALESCSNPIERESALAKYCSTNCRGKAYYERNRERVLAQQKAKRPERREIDSARQRRWRANPANRERERAKNRERYATDPQKHMSRTIRWRENYPDRARLSARKAALKFQYGLLPEDYESLLAEQNGGCAICGAMEPKRFGLHVDHDHRCCPETKTCGYCVRGLLCEDCNISIGRLGDDPQRLRVAADYLDRTMARFPDFPAERPPIPKEIKWRF